MVLLKVLSLVVAAVLSLMAFRFMMREMQAVKAKARRPQDSRRLRRLRQDPRTGVYYPED